MRGAEFVWSNRQGYIIHLFVDEAGTSLLTLERPNGHLEVLRRYEYFQRERAAGHARLLAEAMQASEGPRELQSA